MHRPTNLPPRRTLPILLLSALLGSSSLTGYAQAEAAKPPSPHFQEVLRLLRTHLIGVNEEALNDALVDGLLSRFHPRVLLDPPTPAEGEEAGPLRRTALYEDQFAYLGVRTLTAGLPGELSVAISDLESTTPVDGFILDLRQASGWDYEAAAAVADRFADPDQLLLGWGDIENRSPTDRTNTVPVVVLVNRKTSGAAEALAGALREAAPAVVLGSPTAGEAYAMESFPLENGQKLFIASSPVWVGDHVGIEDGVTPDIETPDQYELDAVWIEDPYQLPPGAEDLAVNGRLRPRFNEADLVRQHEGVSASTTPPETAEPGEEPELVALVIQDPSLDRALALLRGLTRVRAGIRR